MINFDPIEKNLFIGSAPQNEIDVTRLKNLKVTAILSLQSDEDFKHHRIDWKKLSKVYDTEGVLVERFPIQDFSEQDLGEKVSEPINALNRLLAVGHTVYVHCNAGICRAPATVVGYFCAHKGMPLDEALSYVRSRRPQANPYVKAVELGVIQALAK